MPKRWREVKTNQKYQDSEDPSPKGIQFLDHCLLLMGTIQVSKRENEGKEMAILFTLRCLIFQADLKKKPQTYFRRNDNLENEQPIKS